MICCKNCKNLGELKLVPVKDGEYFSKMKYNKVYVEECNDEYLCVSCYNLQQWAKGELYVCNYCSLSAIRVHNTIACDSCNFLLTQKSSCKIPLINLKQQHYFHYVMKELTHSLRE